ncbi:methyl-accepting chemotaxis protein [Chromobacterium sp. IIBBL 290-4]|uniref:methyl-accepting chemotaxis protein n=1 Tax=Chromobacterium sp. IIBBL 290-4 TaxID=2953890 RepID=UPI0020B642B0|nr:methyl-accepting chemotaxis protein [Chromobacterium sp. IIBBL 290-4]UTH74019.1 methyl-accepting chemotaxis protein [Chromobacterium sp. IIBBL 290-4]
MSLLQDMRTRRKLALLLAIPLLGIIAVAAEGLLTMAELKDHVAKVYVSSAAPLYEVSKVSSLVPRTRIDVMQAMMDAGGSGTAYRSPKQRADRLASKIVEMREAVNRLQQGHISAELRPQVEAISAVYQDMATNSLQPFVDAIRADKIEDAKTIYPRFVKQYETLRDQVNALMPLQLKLAETAYQDANQTYQSQSKVIYLVLAFSFLLSLVIGMLLSRQINGELDDLRATMLEAANHLRLSLRARGGGKDEFGELADAFNRLMSAFQSALQRIHSLGEQVSERAHAVADASRAIADGSRAQSEAAQRTNTAVENVAASVQQVAQTAQDSRELSQSLQTLSVKGGQVLGENASKANTLHGAIHKTAEVTQSLEQRSQEINKIVSVIRDIAEQTNLLALNAAIEAARAGEMGRGFAVVADEVRKLAERTTSATSEIGSMLGGIQGDVSNVVEDAKMCAELIEDSRRCSEQAMEALQAIRDGADTSARQISAIAGSTVEQNRATADIVQRIEQIAVMANDNNRSVQSAADAADSLTSLVAQLEDETNRFRLQ